MLLVNTPKNTHMFYTMPSWLHGTAQDQNHVQYVIYVQYIPTAQPSEQAPHGSEDNFQPPIGPSFSLSLW